MQVSTVEHKPSTAVLLFDIGKVFLRVYLGSVSFDTAYLIVIEWFDD